MTNTSKVTITAATLSLLVALGFGYYQANKHETLPDPYTNSRTTTTTESATVTPAAPLDTPPDATASAPPPRAIGTPNLQTAQPYGTPAANTAYTVAPAQSVNGAAVNPNNGLTPEMPTSAPLTQSTTTLTQQTLPPQTTVIEKKTVVVEHRPVYTRHIVAHHHKSDKVHVARAAKHATMFAAKLPGRLRL